MSFACQQSDSQDAILAFGIDQQIETFSVDQLVRILGRFCIADSGISKRTGGMSRYLIYLMMGYEMINSQESKRIKGLRGG